MDDRAEAMRRFRLLATIIQLGTQKSGGEFRVSPREMRKLGRYAWSLDVDLEKGLMVSLTLARTGEARNPLQKYNSQQLNRVNVGAMAVVRSSTGLTLCVTQADLDTCRASWADLNLYVYEAGGGLVYAFKKRRAEEAGVVTMVGPRGLESFDLSRFGTESTKPN